MTSEARYTIGELAAGSGLAVKTIRFYSDEGILPPAGRTASGYRLYRDADRGRLELIRTLRDIGFDLTTIRDVLDRDVAMDEALDLQLRAVELQLRTLRAARSVLRRAQRQGGDDPRYLGRLHALARLTARERSQLVDDFFRSAAGDAPIDPEWLEGMAAASTPDLPDDPTDEQLDAWLELAELATDPGLQANLRKQSSSAWDERRPDFDAAAWRAANDALIGEIVAAMDAGTAPADAAAQPLLDRFEALIGVPAGRVPDAALRAEQLRLFDEHDDRAARWWELVAILQGWPSPAPTIAAYRWLQEGLRTRVNADQQRR